MAEPSSLSPTLTGVVQGAIRPENAGNYLFPTVFVSSSGGKTIIFPPEQFMLASTARAAGGDFSEVQFGIDGLPYYLGNHGLIGKIAQEDIDDVASVMPDLDLQADTAQNTMGLILLSLEVQQAKLATNPATYNASNKIALVGGAKWSAATGNPFIDIDTGKEAIRARVGMRANTAIFSPVAFTAAKNNPVIQAKFNPTSAKAITREMLADALDVKQVVIADAIAANGNGSATYDVWGNNVVLAYVPPMSADQARSIRQPSFGYTYVMKGHPNARVPYFDEKTGSWKTKVIMQREPYVVGKDSGYLIQNPF